MSNTISNLPAYTGLLPQDVVAAALPKRSGGAEGGVSPEMVQTPVEQQAIRQAEEQKTNKSTSELNREALERAVEHANKTMQSYANSELHFTIDNETGISTVKIIDKETGEVIRQIPSQEMIDIAKSIDQMRGALIKQRV